MDNKWEAPTRWVLETSIENFEEKYGEVVDEKELLDAIDKEIAQITAKWWPDMEEKLQKVYEEQIKIKEFFRRYEEDKDISIRDIQREFFDLEEDIKMVEGMWFGQKIIEIIKMVDKKWWKQQKNTVRPFYKKYNKDSQKSDVVFLKTGFDKMILEDTEYNIDDLLSEIYKAKTSWKSFGRAISSLDFSSRSSSGWNEYHHFLDENDKKLLLQFVFDRAEWLVTISDIDLKKKYESGYDYMTLIPSYLKWNTEYLLKFLWKFDSINTEIFFLSVFGWIGDNPEVIDVLLEKAKDIKFEGTSYLAWWLANATNNDKLKSFLLERIHGDKISDGDWFRKLLKYPELLDQCWSFSDFSIHSSDDIEDIDVIMPMVWHSDFAFIYALIRTSEYKNLQQIILEEAKDLKITHKWAHQLYQKYKVFLTKSVIDEVESKKL